MSDKQAKSLADYQQIMLRAFQELFQVLKPGRWLTVAFHNSRMPSGTQFRRHLALLGLLSLTFACWTRGKERTSR